MEQYISTLPTHNGDNIKVLFLMATTHEYGDALKAEGINPIIVGVGPVESSINTLITLKDLERQSITVDLVINIGSAGSKTYDYKSVYQVTSFSYRDINAFPIGFKRGITPFSEWPSRLNVTGRIPNLAETTLSTGGDFIEQEAYLELEDNAVDMEGYAIYRACATLGIPMLKIIGISDGKESMNGEAANWTKYLHDIDINIANVLKNLKESLIRGTVKKENLVCLPPEITSLIKK